MKILLTIVFLIVVAAPSDAGRRQLRQQTHFAVKQQKKIYGPATSYYRAKNGQPFWSTCRNVTGIGLNLSGLPGGRVLSWLITR